MDEEVTKLLDKAEEYIGYDFVNRAHCVRRMMNAYDLLVKVRGLVNIEDQDAASQDVRKRIRDISERMLAVLQQKQKEDGTWESEPSS